MRFIVIRAEYKFQGAHMASHQPHKTSVSKITVYIHVPYHTL